MNLFSVWLVYILSILYMFILTGGLTVFRGIGVCKERYRWIHQSCFWRGFVYGLFNSYYFKGEIEGEHSILPLYWMRNYNNSLTHLSVSLSSQASMYPLLDIIAINYRYTLSLIMKLDYRAPDNDFFNILVSTVFFSQSSDNRYFSITFSQQKKSFPWSRYMYFFQFRA